MGEKDFHTMVSHCAPSRAALRMSSAALFRAAPSRARGRRRLGCAPGARLGVQRSARQLRGWVAGSLVFLLRMPTWVRDKVNRGGQI